MIGIVRDIVRAALVLVVLAVGLELLQAYREAARPPQPPPPYMGTERYPPYMGTERYPPYMGTEGYPPSVVTVEPPRPIRRVGRAIVELAESVLGVVR